MSRRTLTSWLPAPKRTRRSRPWLGIEYLEDRTMPDASLPPDLVVGRTLSAYTVAGVQNRQLDITYTVYNQRADDLSGVLLTTALQPGVTYKSATAVPDRSGSELAWSLGTVRGFDRASVTVTVALPETLPLQIDSGAKAFATLNAGAVSADTPAAALSSRTIAPELLASTPDANTADPFVQEQAAKLRYDPARIVQYLSTDVGYESYSGSLRGSRGTLWSAAGNALDEASLGVALLRASGVPARYARGTLSDALSKQLILSMFPAGYQTVGYIPAGTTVADPADDPKLLAEARDHYWVQLDTGGGFVSADTSGLPGSGLGAAFTATSDTFAEVADGLRHKVGLKLNVEKYSSAGALFGFGNGLSTAPVLDRMFNTVDLVGRTLTVGHLVNEQSLGALVFSARTTTYSPFLIIGDAATGLAGDQVVNGTDYQDVRTNFPLGSQVVTGVFLDLTFAGPGRADRAARYTLADRVGPAARLGTATTSVSVDPNGPPLFGPVDLTTLAVLPGKVDPRVMARPASDIDAQEAAYAALPGGVPTDEPGRQALGAAVIALVRNTLLAESRVQLADFFSSSDAWATAFAGNLGVRAYHDGPRVAIVRATGGAGRLGFAIDLTKNDIRVLARPGQNPAAAVTFNLTRGMMDTYLETAAITPPAGSAAAPVGAHGVMAEAVARGVPFVTLTAANASELDGLPFPADVKALITRAVAGGKAVLVPDRPVEVGGAARLAWFEMDPATGESVGVLDDGTHGAGWLSYMGSLLLTRILVAAEEFGMGLIAGGIFNVTFLSIKSWKELAFKSASGGAGNAVSKALAIAGLVAIFKFGQTQVERLLFKSVAFVSGFLIASNWGLQALQKDPPVLPILIEPGQPVPPPPSRDAETVPVAAGLAAGAVAGSARAGSVRAAGRLTATWSGAGTFRAATLSAPAATVRDAAGNVVGSGAVALSAAAELAVAGGTYRVTGNGSLSFYGPAGAALGAGGDWADYSAAVTGNPTFTTSGGLTLNGTALPAGTYTITAASATLTGRGATSAPTFAGSASVAVTDGAVNVGPGTGNLSVGGAALDPAAETTLDGYTGTLTVTGDGSDADAVTLDGTAAHVLRVTAPAGLAADQNTPVTFRAAVGTSLGGDYTISAEAPAGWAVAVDAAGNVTVTPAPGSPAGSYPVRVVARSNANPDLVAQTAAAVAVAATAPGLTLVVTADPVFTAPYAGAQIPTSFQAAVRNLGPAADGYTVAASNVPAGFEVVTSRGGPLTIPAGRPGVVGLYLRPVAGAVLPAPGTPLSFTVTATSATDPTLTRTQTVSFTMPEAHGVTVAVDPAGAGATPGTTVAGTLTLRAVGNVAETVNLLTVLPTGLTLAGLSATATLQPGQSVALPFTLTVAADTPLNTTLTAGLTARFSPLGEAFDVNVRIPVRVAVPGAAAIGTAAEAAGRLGQPDLAARLRELSTALTGLVQYPASRVYKGQATAALDTIARLLAANQDLADLAPPVRADAAALTAAVTPAAIQAAVVALGNTLGVTGATLADAADTRFTIGFERNSQVGRPQVGAEYRLVLQNTGAATTTYDLAVTGLPAGVTTAFSQTSITLDPGQVTPGAGVPTVTLTLTSTSATDLVPFGFTVTATARGAARVARSAAGEFTVRDALVRVPVVATDPPFTDPGGTVRVTARILNAVNKQQDARASFTVTAPGGAVVFTSTPVAVTLNVLTTLTTADLGTFDTTGFARGDYAIAVTVTDAAGTPISGATGSGALLVGTPVSATLSTTPDAAPAGTATVATTLQATSRETFAAPLTPVGTVAIPGAAAVVTRGDRAYVAGTGGIRVVNVADPTNPQVLSTFGAEDIPAGLGIGALELDGDRLVAMINKFDATPDNKIVIYSLADPDAPVRLGQTPLTVGGIDPTGLAPFAVVDHRVYTAAFWYRRFIFGNNVFGQWGESVVVDISDPAAPAVVDVVYNRTPEPNYVYPDGLRWPDGTSNIWQIAGAGRSTVLVGTTANTKNVVNDKGQILVVDNTNPNDPEVVRTLDVPGMSVVTGIAVSGTTGLVIGSSLGWYSGYGPVGLNGKVVAARIDLTDPRNPVLGPTRTFDIDSFGMHYLERTDNGLYVTNSVDPATNAARLLVFDPRGAGDVTVTPVPIPAGIGADSFGTAGNLVLTGDGSNLIIYEFGEAAGTPATARVTVPAGVTAAGFNTAPTRTVANPDGSQTLEWDVAFGSGNTSRTFTWQSTVTGLQPGGSAVVAVNGEVTFTSGGADGTVPLPDQVVAGRQVIGITPAARTVAPGAATTYAVTLANPTAADVTYTLSAQGVPAGWVGLPPTAAVPANGTADVTLTLTPPAFAALQDYGFSVTATAGGATGSAPATLTVAGTPVAPDPESHGVVVRLMTATATAGQGVSARYVVRLTNTGSATETFALTAALPAGVTGAFDRASVEVPPGVGNFREVVLVVTPAAGTRGGAYPVDVTAASADATGTAAGSLAVTTAGVSVALDRAAGAPGEAFTATVTNTGAAADTFDLAAGGPAGLVAALGDRVVSLAPGESKAVTVTTTPAAFAAQGALGLAVTARSRAAPSVAAAAEAVLAVPPAAGLAAALDPPARTLQQPGPADFLVRVDNTGNAEDQYAATITGTTGPVTADLVGLDGLPTQAVPSFRLPGLSSGAVRLRTTLAAAGTGTVTVVVRSLADPARTATVTATVTTVVPVVPPVSPPPPPVSPPPPPPVDPIRQRLYAVGAGPGGGPRVQVFDAADDKKLWDFFAFDSTLRGGVAVATGDVTGDGVEDIVAGAGAGGAAHVRVFDGATGAEVAGWYAYEESFRGGVWVAAADLDGDGTAEVVTGAGAGGGPVVKVWSVAGGTPALARTFLAFDAGSRGGATVAVGVGAAGRPVIAAGSGPGSEARVRTFDAASLALLSDVGVYEPSFLGGVYVAAGDGTGAGTQFLVGPGAGGGPRLRVLNPDGSAGADVFAAAEGLRNGLTVAALDRVGGPPAVLVGAGAGAFRGRLTADGLGGLARVGLFEPSFDGGVFVG